MPDRDVNIEEEPHYDGTREGIISDSIGKQVGIRTDTGDNTSNPYHVKSLKKNSDMEKFHKTRDN
ncbi:hypothetical protein [Oceanobacillus halotolerans]|uniref:hypothetical protein n=1 Tax=Oceanobacillus halotolerans TaxID=2663380 RepID=UPI0013DC2946|nr:hypothetical protein [Oceanobacillus halotolerans]